MIALNPLRNGPVAEQSKLDIGQNLADRDGCQWELYLVYAGDRSVIVSYEFWQVNEGVARKQAYYGRQPDYIFTPRGVIF